MEKELDILAFSPHPDDAELGCAGSLILAADEKKRVAIADLSDGELSSRGTTGQRKKEKMEASKNIGLCERFSLCLPDTKIGLDSDHLLYIIELIRQTRPKIVLAPYWIDRHPDHEASGRLVRDACFYSGISSIGKERPYSPERVYYYMIHTPFPPSFVIDISDVWERKKAVLDSYRSQFIDDGQERFKTALCMPEFLRFHEAKAIYFGGMISVAFGEPFYSMAPISFKEFPGIDGEGRQEDLPKYFPI